MPDTQIESRADIDGCIVQCQTCHRSCLETMFHCLERGGAYAAPDHIRLLADCAAICETAANFMLRGSSMHGAVCAVCAEVCDQCAVECDTFANDRQMAQCAEICRQCAESCEEMAGM
ncbi:MAG: four-helix bundle copper-binding protein [Alphaproteobacteria bacterium]